MINFIIKEIKNQKSSGFDNTGHKHSEETKAKISAAKKGKPLSRPRSDETKAKMSAARKGKTLTNETKAKISLAKKGKTLTEETKAKIAVIRKGKPHPPRIPHTAEAIARMSAAHIKFLYYSPIGIVNDARDLEPIIKSKALRDWCNNPDKIISRGSYAKSKYLHENYNTDIIGKTFRELGFYKLANIIDDKEQI